MRTLLAARVFFILSAVAFLSLGVAHSALRALVRCLACFFCLSILHKSTRRTSLESLARALHDNTFGSDQGAPSNMRLQGRWTLCALCHCGPNKVYHSFSLFFFIPNF